MDSLKQNYYKKLLKLCKHGKIPTPLLAGQGQLGRVTPSPLW